MNRITISMDSYTQWHLQQEAKRISVALGIGYGEGFHFRNIDDGEFLHRYGERERFGNPNGEVIDLDAVLPLNGRWNHIPVHVEFADAALAARYRETMCVGPART